MYITFTTKATYIKYRTMLHNKLFTVVRKTICLNVFHILDNTSKLSLKQCNISAHSLYHQNHVLLFKRFKYEGNIPKQENDEFDSDVDDYLNTNKSKILTVSLPSLRMDVVAKAAFRLSRTRMEKEFYRSNVRINGQKCLKKSTQVKIGDEIDLILNRSPTNHKHLIVNRCVLLTVIADPNTEKLEAKIVQNKSLLIEEYEEKWHESQ